MGVTAALAVATVISLNDGTNPALPDCNNGGNQTWTSTDAPNFVDAKYLEAAGGGTADGTAVQITTATDPPPSNGG
jgi:hypothetical protein